MFAGGAEWSATGLPGRSLAGDSFGQADNKFAAARTLSRLTEMNGVDYLEGQLARWEEASASGKHAMGGEE